MQRFLVCVAAIATATVAFSHASIANDDCEAMPPGPARTDCFILRARIHGLKSSTAATAASQKKGAAKLEGQTGTRSDPTPPAQRPQN